MLRLKIDPAIVAPWEIPALEVFRETWEHVLSSSLMYSVRTGRRGFNQTEKIYKAAVAGMKRFEQETLTIDLVVPMVAEWCGLAPKANPEDRVMAWAADESTAQIVAAEKFARALYVALSSRPQMTLPM
jgi:hypothetical protein